MAKDISRGQDSVPFNQNDKNMSRHILRGYKVK